jgi:catechol 2,3-dioxygenase-like lactoylglutathione lyase family enzyme
LNYQFDYATIILIHNYRGYIVVKGLNHVTIVVSNISKAMDFFSLLGFKKKHADVLSPEVVASSMGITHSEGADHVSLSLQPELTDSLEIQLLHYRGVTPEPQVAASLNRAFRLGYDHIAFEVRDIEATISKLLAQNIILIKEIFIVGQKKLAFIEGPDGITIELAELI